MQRRAAAIYVVFFVLVAVGAFSLTTVAQEPSVSVAGQNYSQGDTLSAGGTEWTVNVNDGEGNVSRVNESARFTTSIANNSSLLFANGEYRPAPNGSDGGAGTGTGSPSPSATATSGGSGTSLATGETASNDSATRFRVVIPNATAGNASGGNASGGNATNVSSFTLRQEFVTSQRLRQDSSVADVALTGENGTQYVRYRNGTTQPLDEYLPTPEVRNVSVGDSFPYENNSSSVASVNTSGATLAWEGNLTRSTELKDGENATIGETTYVAQFPTNSTVTLSQNVSGYQAEQAKLDEFNNRILGLWGIVIISLFAAILIVALAYMPVRG
ncbi:hypothetical protein [Halococcus qingdaonensis]|uniref:hypothetical protein n=1 Tax=Halococcus qingdaonensis TaxID=224402 RepID=UPI002116A5DD|nr:hypothetical protein [Halococcus qingdaonensis]